MIIQILSNLFEEGYLSRSKYTALSPFFAGANVAFRREALIQTGDYDINCLSGEDQDMCLRIARAGWELYFEPKAIIRHKNQMTLRAFVRKWFDYGFHHPYIFQKHGSKGLKIYGTKRAGNNGESIYNTIIKMRFPFNIYLFLTPFLIMHILIFLAILIAVLGYFIPAVIAAVLALVTAIAYFRSDLATKNPIQSIHFIFFRYAANIALILGGFLGGLKYRMLYISATFDYTA